MLRCDAMATAGRQSCAARLPAFAKHDGADAQRIFTPFARALYFLLHCEKLRLQLLVE
jgi:hypothetical protein